MIKIEEIGQRNSWLFDSSIRKNEFKDQTFSPRIQSIWREMLFEG